MTAVWNDRWYLLDYHEVQAQLMATSARFVTVPAGRRSGKTECAKRYLLGKAMDGTRHNPSRFFFGAPTRQQAKDIFWQDIQALLPSKIMKGSPNISELCVKIRNFSGGESHIYVHGLDKPERVEGSPWDGCVIDEIANCKAGAWPLHIRPSLSTPGRPGWAWLIGVPEGRNFYYDMHKFACSDQSGEWAGYWWPSEDILPQAEIEAAKRDLDELSFEQEYRGSFITFAGQAYYNFRAELHEAPLDYDPQAPLVLAFDFNVEPGVAVLGQEMALPNGQFGTGWIGQVHIPRNSNTPAVCRKIAEDWGAHQGPVKCYGDATGGARRTSSEFGNDWQIVARDLRPVFGERVTFHVKSYNPSERSRINAVNSRLRTAEGVVHMMVDPEKCPALVKDFEGVTLLEGGSGEIDKKADPKLSHISDAVGYYVAEEFPVSRRVTGHIPSADIEAAIHA